MFQNKEVLQYSLRHLRKRKTAYIWLVSSIVLDVVTPLMAVYYPKIVLDCLMERKFQLTLFSVACFILLETMLIIARSGVQTRIKGIQRDIDSRIYAEIAEISLSIPYQVSESSEFIENKNKAMAGLNVRSGTMGIYISICSVVSAIIRVAISGAAFSALNIWFILIIIITVLMNAYVYQYTNKLEEKFWKSLIHFNRMFSYIFMKLSCSFRFAKDIRLYAMADVVEEKNEEFIQYTKDMFRKKYQESLPYKLFHEVIGQMQMVLIYGFLLYLAFCQKINTTSFMVLLAAAIALKGWLHTIIYGCVDINAACSYLKYFYNLSKYKNMVNSAGLSLDIDMGTRNIIEFKNVFFKYENTDVYALEDVSIQIPLDENLAVVGENGSGKTTFIKLMLGLYKPEKGTITLNGRDIQEYRIEEYLRLFSVVFQDYCIYPMTIMENIVFDEMINEERIFKILEKLDLMPVIKNLKYGMDTVLNDSSQPNVVRLSGGQEQMVAIARALYKKASVVIMDEPTASLDPISENKIYQNVFRSVDEQHVIFISHRMSCCRNADTILVFQKGKLVQAGSHENLIKESGIYHRLYTAQEHFYT